MKLHVDSDMKMITTETGSVQRQHPSPRNGDFIAASTMPTSSCRLLGSWASPEAKAASASAWRPRYWRATPCRKYACKQKNKREQSYQGSGHLPQHGVLFKHITRHTHFTPFAFLTHEQFPEHGTSPLCTPIMKRSVSILYLLIGL